MNDDSTAVHVVPLTADALRAERIQAQLAAIVDSSNDAIIGKTLDGMITSWNPGATRIFGYSASEVIGRSIMLLVPSERGEEESDILRQIASGKNVKHFETIRIGKNGNRIEISVTISPVTDSSGKIIGASKIARVTSEQNRLLRQLQESEERFRTMANSMSQMAWIAHSDGHIFWYNQRWYEYTGTTPEQMEEVGWQSVHDPKELPRVLRTWQDAIAARSPMEIEFPLRGADGVFRSFLTRAIPVVDALGHIAQWCGTNTDVQTLKQTEEKIRQENEILERRVAARTSQLQSANLELIQSRREITSLFESLPGLFLVLTPEFSIVSASDAYLQATMTDRAQIIGRDLFEVFPDNPTDQTASGVTNLRASLNRVKQSIKSDTMAIQKYDVRRPDGTFEVRYWSPINSPVLGVGHSLKYIIHRVEDVTDFVKHTSQPSGGHDEMSARMQQMEAEVFLGAQKLLSTNLKLEEANKELESFCYSVSHDLRAPLRGIDGYVRMLKEDCASRLDDDGNRMLNVVSGEARRMGRLIDDLLAFSRIGRQPLERTPVDMNSLSRTCFESAVALFPTIPQFELHSLPQAMGDPALLRQVFANLIGNAIKFSARHAQPTIEIGSRKQDAGCLYYVKDNGVGFDEKYMHKLFCVFQRLHSEEEFEGTGVGLAIVQRIVQRHGGKVWAEGKPGNGATFYFTLPS